MGLADRFIVHRKINLFGKGESDIETRAMDLTARGRVPEVGITAHDATISFRITGVGVSEEEARALTQPTAELIYERFGSLVLGEGSDDVAEALAAALARTGSTLATAESCTGGLIAHLVTAIPGVSAYYMGGAVTYSNASKAELLGVPAALIAEHGAVSPEVAAAMAEGVRTPARRHHRRQHHRRRRPRRRHAREARGAGLPGIVDGRRHPDPTPRHGRRTPPRVHPDLLSKGRAQLGAIGPDRREIGSGRFANPGAGGRSERGYRL